MDTETGTDGVKGDHQEPKTENAADQMPNGNGGVEASGGVPVTGQLQVTGTLTPASDQTGATGATGATDHQSDDTGATGAADPNAKPPLALEDKTDERREADREEQEKARQAENEKRDADAMRQSYDLVGSHQIDPGLALRAVVFIMLRHGMPAEAFQEAVAKVSAFEPEAVA